MTEKPRPKVIHVSIGHSVPLTVIATKDVRTLLEYPDGMRLWQRTADLAPAAASEDWDAHDFVQDGPATP